MRRSGKVVSVGVPILLTCVAVTWLVLSLVGIGGVSVPPERLGTRLVYPLLRMLVFLAIGLLVGQIIESTGWTGRLAGWVRPVTRWGHFREPSGAAFVASFVSGIVSNTLLMGSHREGKISRRELTLAYLTCNGLPMYLVHLPTTFFIVSSLAGQAGLIYLAIGFLAACVRSTGTLLVARVVLPAASEGPAEPAKKKPPRATRLGREIVGKFRSRFLRLLMYSVPIYVMVFLAAEWGVFVRLRNLLAGWVSVDFFPIEAASVVIFAVAAEFTSGFAAGGALIEAGALSVKQTAVALVLGTIAAAPVRAVRHQLPTHAGIFSLGLATELLIMSQGLRTLSLLIVTVTYALWG
ncbi:MAG: nucleoside recognition domain-containing protein [Thermodesulfobacteriota bacterium]